MLLAFVIIVSTCLTCSRAFPGNVPSYFCFLTAWVFEVFYISLFFTCLASFHFFTCFDFLMRLRYLTCLVMCICFSCISSSVSFFYVISVFTCLICLHFLHTFFFYMRTFYHGIIIPTRITVTKFLYKSLLNFA